MARVAILGDTHVPGRADDVPEVVWERIRAADHVVHTGDLTSEEILTGLEAATAGTLTVVRGNMDRGLDLPEVATLTVEGVSFVVTHGTGSPSGWADRIRETILEHADGSAVGVAGHTHEVVDIVEDCVRLLNPGSATGAAPADRATMLTAGV